MNVLSIPCTRSRPDFSWNSLVQGSKDFKTPLYTSTSKDYLIGYKRTFRRRWSSQIIGILLYISIYALLRTLCILLCKEQKKRHNYIFQFFNFSTVKRKSMVLWIVNHFILLEHNRNIQRRVLQLFVGLNRVIMFAHFGERDLSVPLSD